MGVLWVTWQLQSLGAAPYTSWRREGDLLCGKLDVTLRSCIMSWWTLQRARQLYSMTMRLWMMMVCQMRVRRQFELLLSTRTWTCMSWIPLQQRFRVAGPPLSFRPNAGMSALSQRITATSTGRPERPKTSTQSEVVGARGVGAQIFGTSFDTAVRLCMSEVSGAWQLWQRRS